MALYMLDRPNEALPLLREAASLEYQKATTLYCLGRCAYELGDLITANNALRESLAVELDADYRASSHYVLGLTCHRLGKYENAVREFEWCLENDTEPCVAKWKVLTAIVDSLKGLGMLRDAERYSKILNFHNSTQPAPPRTDP